MSLKVYSVLDAKTGVYSQPMINHSDESMMRDALAPASDPSTKFYQWPEDFHLFLIGMWDETKGIIKGAEAPIHIASFVELKRMALQGKSEAAEPVEQEEGNDEVND